MVHLPSDQEPMFKKKKFMDMEITDVVPETTMDMSFKNIISSKEASQCEKHTSPSQNVNATLSNEQTISTDACIPLPSSTLPYTSETSNAPPPSTLQENIESNGNENMPGMESTSGNTSSSGNASSLFPILNRSTPFGNETSKSVALGCFEPGEATIDFLSSDCSILVIGAGGLGCEILKDLALSGFTKIQVIDMDCIDLTNLNRQFLFREKDIGASKAKVAAEFITQRIPHVNVIGHYGKIQDYDMEFYQQFSAIVSGLDNIEARRWLNSMIVAMVDVDEEGIVDPETIIPLIDGGTEGLKGQARVIIPRITSCFECSLDSFPPQRAFPLCTIAETPRQPEHCIAYAYIINFPKAFPDKKLDTDSPTDMTWVYENALERAVQYGIEGVTYKGTLGVVKNIIPAVASTNAIISAMCVNEVFKVMSYASQTMDTYHMYMGSEGIYSHTFCYEKNPECPVCSSTDRNLRVPKTWTLEKLIEHLTHSDGAFRLKKPSISKSGCNLFMQGPPALREALSINLNKTLHELEVREGDVLAVTDPVYVGDTSLSLIVNFENE